MSDLLANLSEGLSKAIVKVWDSFIEVVPTLILALVIIVAGWLIANLVKKIVTKILQSTKIDQWIDEQNLTSAIGGKEMSSLIGSFVKWYLIWVALWVAADSIKLYGLSQFVQALVFYIPQVLAAMLVVILGLLLGRYLKNALEATEHEFKRVAGTLTEIVVALLSGILALTLVIGKENMDPVITMLKTILDPFLWSIAIAIGIAVGITFGLAFREEIQQFSKEIKKAYLK